jgi:hypothetical protein
MEYMRIKPVTEDDFDQVVISAGGSRILEEGSADYQLNEAIIELKLVVEEGFKKIDRQKKLAHLFRDAQPNLPVVLLNPRKLNESDSRNYYRIVEVPIKNACKKASKQLQITAARFTHQPVRVLVILNVGYTLLSADEFKDVCLKCVRNDTTGIDWLICGGIYYYSDKAENFVIARFEDSPINLSRSFNSHSILGEAWEKYLNESMLDMVRNQTLIVDGRMPIVDLSFDLDGIRYVKPAPAMTKSSFWPDGIAPRDNSSGIDKCPVVARVYPLLSDSEWKKFKEAVPFMARLKTSYKEWLKSWSDEKADPPQPLQPIVPVEIKFEEFVNWIKKPNLNWEFSDVSEFSCEVFHNCVRSLQKEARNIDEIQIIPLNYIHLEINEVGTDKANDFASIYVVSVVPGFERREPLVENVIIFYEYGMSVAAAYAIKHRVNAILYTRKRAS